MSDKNTPLLNRRSFVGSALAGTVIGGPAMAEVIDPNVTNIIEAEAAEIVRRNVSGFKGHNWKSYFSNLRNGALLVDTKSRSLHHWTESGQYSLYPTSVPLSDDLTRLGRTSVIRKVVGPGWSPTPNMRKRNPEWPAYIPPGPDNPLGTHALYLSWRYYRIHGTHDNRKIGRKSSNGCIGMYNYAIQEVFNKTPIGAQVLLI